MNWEVDPRMQDAFSEAVSMVSSETGEKEGIGTQGERMLHAILKRYLSRDTATHERTVGRYIADICIGETVLEIQTRRFDKLIPKLRAFLPMYDVTVVYPVAQTKYLSWMDPHTGELSPPRKSPKRGNVQDVFYELFYLKEFINDPHLHIRLILCDMKEYRAKTGWGKDNKRHAPRIERLPEILRGDITLRTKEDYRRLLPVGECVFTTKRLEKAWQVYPECARRAIHVLMCLGILEEAGREGRYKQYRLLP